MLASLNHPNIAQIYGIEESGGTRCIVMELVQGETLHERIKRGPIPVQEALTISKQIAEALEAAHEKGVIHRDLKPGNTPDGKQFLIIPNGASPSAGQTVAASQINVVMNWFEDLKQRAPVR